MKRDIAWEEALTLICLGVVIGILLMYGGVYIFQLNGYEVCK